MIRPKRILFLAPYPVKESPSQRYRFEHYLPYLEKKGIKYDYKPFLGMAAWNIFFRPGNSARKLGGIIGGFLRRWSLMFTISRYDFVYIHREAAPIGPPVFEWIIAKVYRKRIIYDFDDAIWIPVASVINPVARYFKWTGKVSSICKWSYKISAGNDFLAAYAARYNKSVTVIPTVVNTEEVHNRLQDQNTEHPVIGWTGTFSTLKYLDIVLPVLQRLQQRHSFSFIVIANKDPHFDLKDYQFITWKKETEAHDLLRMHIGLMPLYDDDLSKGKCGFKAIQYMSLGIPAVVSPVGVNSIIVDHAINGFICQSQAEWETGIETLLKDNYLRGRMGIAARKKIESEYSVSATQDRFIKLFS